MTLDRESAEWVRTLSPTARAGRGLGAAAPAADPGRRRRAAPPPHPADVTGPELDDLAHQAAADALVSIPPGSASSAARAASRPGRASSRSSRSPPRSAGTSGAGRSRSTPRTGRRLPDRFGIDAADGAEARELVAALRAAVEEELSERQRTAFVAIVLNGVPADALAVQLGSTRNAIYKTLFDARRKLRTALAERGHLDLSSRGGVTERLERFLRHRSARPRLRRGAAAAPRLRRARRRRRGPGATPPGDHRASARLRAVRPGSRRAAGGPAP